MNILFILRADAASKSGGDLIQAKNYQAVLMLEAGYNVKLAHEISREEREATEWDIIHLFNISRMIENSQILKNLKFKTVILSPILQPGFKKTKSLRIKNIIRYIISKKSLPHRLKKHEQEIIEKIGGLVFLSTTEKLAFFEKFPSYIKKPWCIYKNAHNVKIPNNRGERIFDFIIAGRIEPKKRTIEAVAIINETDKLKNIIVAGAINWYHPIYALKFLKMLLAGKLIYAGKQSQQNLYKLMSNTKTLINFSELEVSPLVDIEAIACGCSVLSTKYSYTHLEESWYFRQVDVKNPSECSQSIKHLLENPTTSSDTAIVNLKATWTENSKEYLYLIQSLRGNVSKTLLQNHNPDNFERPNC